MKEKKLLKIAACAMCGAVIIGGSAFALADGLVGAADRNTRGTDAVRTALSINTDSAAPSPSADAFRPERPGNGKGRLFGLDLNMSKYKDMTDEERQAAMLEDAKAQLTESVANGKMTQEQADEILSRIEKMPEAGISVHIEDGMFGIDLDISKYKDMTAEERQAAILEDAKAQLAESVANGKLTQEKANEILSRIEKMPSPGELPEGGIGARIKGGMMGLDLDMSKYSNMTADEAKAAMIADAKTSLAAKVAEGTITQEQADAMLEKLEGCTMQWAPRFEDNGDPDLFKGRVRGSKEESSSSSTTGVSFLPNAVKQ